MSLSLAEWYFGTTAIKFFIQAKGYSINYVHDFTPLPLHALKRWIFSP